MTNIKNSGEELKKKLTSEQYDICVLKGTEPPFSGKYNKHYSEGMYNCVVCKRPLFSSETKYDSGSGWPSFWDYAVKGSIATRRDNAFGMQRTEVLCENCGSHLGHVFEDGPKVTGKGKPVTGLRYCINSLALEFKPKK